jgi:hypothetical protein
LDWCFRGLAALRIGVEWKPCCINITPCPDIWILESYID